MIKGPKYQKHNSFIYVTYVGVYNFYTMYKLVENTKPMKWK
jgi:hypothetical protein